MTVFVIAVGKFCAADSLFYFIYIWLNLLLRNMVKKFLIDLLMSPDSQTAPAYDPVRNTLHDTVTGRIYDIVKDTPVIFSAEKTTDSSPLHQKSNTSFNYKDHYNKDAEYFDYFAEDDIPAEKAERRRSRETIISKIRGDGLYILDIGCGGGWIAEHFTENKNYVVSLDISLKNPAEALKKYPSEFHAAVVADAYNLPFRENSFDVIVASEVIEHLTEPDIFIAKWIRILKPGGKLIMLTPYNEKIIYHTCVHCNHVTPANAHLRSFNEKNIYGFLPGEGIRIITSKFNNKYFTKLRIYSFLGFLPFRLWFLLDKFVNEILKKPALFIIEISKK